MRTEDCENSYLSLLRQAPGFRDLTAEAARFICEGCQRRTATRGEVLYQKGETLLGFYVLLDGRVKLAVLSPDGAEMVVDIVLPGHTFAESAALLGRPCPLYAQAIRNCRLLFVDLRRMRAAIERWPMVAFAMLALVAERNQRLTNNLEVCCLHSATQRLVGYLLREAVSNTKQTDAATVHLPASKTLVASNLNLSAETFSRELHALARRGLISVERREIRIPSLQALRRLSTDVRDPVSVPMLRVAGREGA